MGFTKMTDNYEQPVQNDLAAAEARR